MADVFYICDQLKCENCSAVKGLCFYTSDITHAANFVQIDDGIYVETEFKRILEQKKDGAGKDPE